MRGERTHEVLDEIIHTLVVVSKPRARIRVRGLLILSTMLKRSETSDTYLESCDVAIVAGREERWGRFERCVCDRVRGHRSRNERERTRRNVLFLLGPVDVHGLFPCESSTLSLGAFALAFLAENVFEILGAPIGIFGVGGVFERARKLEKGELFGECLSGCQRLNGWERGRRTGVPSEVGAIFFLVEPLGGL